MPGRPYLFLTVVLGLLAAAAVFVGTARFVWWQGGSSPTLPALPFALGVSLLAAAALSALRIRSNHGVVGESVGTIRGAFLTAAAVLLAGGLLSGVAGPDDVGRLEWLVSATGVGLGLGALLVSRLVAGGLVDRLLDTLARHGSVLARSGDAVTEQTPGFRFARFLVVGSLVAAFVNAAIPAPPVSLPVRLHDEPALDHLIATEQTHLANNYLLYAQLRELASGATIIVPPQEILATYTLAGLSLLEVRTEDYDPELPQDLAVPLLDQIDASGETETELGGGTRPYVIAIGGPDRSVLRLVMVGDTVAVLDDGAYRSALGAG